MTELPLAQLKKYLPYSYENIIRNLIDGDVKTILDIGTGDGGLMKYINRDNEYKIIGVEGYKPFLQTSIKSGAYKKIVLRKAEDLDFSKRSFDLVICSQVLEYLTKKEGIKLIEKCLKIAKKQVIFAAYIGDCRHNCAEGNPFQTSKSAWFPHDLTDLGFKVYGQGLGLVYKEVGYKPKGNTVLNMFPRILSYILSPVSYRFPPIATHMIGVKNVK